MSVHLVDHVYGAGERAFRLTNDKEARTNLASRKAVLGSLCRHARDDGSESRPSVAVIGQETGLNTGTVKAARFDLEDANLISCVEGRNGGRGLATEWRVNARKLMAAWADRKPCKMCQKSRRTHANSWDNQSGFPPVSEHKPGGIPTGNGTERGWDFSERGRDFDKKGPESRPPISNESVKNPSGELARARASDEDDLDFVSADADQSVRSYEELPVTHSRNGVAAGYTNGSVRSPDLDEPLRFECAKGCGERFLTEFDRKTHERGCDGQF